MSVARLKTATLRTSRVLDFFSEKELTAQTGHGKLDWPLVVLKELVDNALDGCEDARQLPEIAVTVDPSGITVSDNGPGIAADVISDLLNYSFRVSSREHYVSPTRGAQGNALKTIIAMPLVLDGEVGRVDIATRGIRHEIVMKVNRIHQEPNITHLQRKDRFVRNGVRVKIHWPNSASSILESARDRFLQIADDYAFLNPHLSLRVNWFGEKTSVRASAAKTAKWLPSNPTCPHWYTLDRFQRLISGYLCDDVARGRDRTIREFVSEFAGLTATAKQKAVLEEAGLTRMNLSALSNGHDLKLALVARLLSAMKLFTKPIKAPALGVIGRDHLSGKFEALRCEMETFQYRRIAGEKEGLPWLLEVAFAWSPQTRYRRLITGVNWSPGIVNPFRQLGSRGQSLDSVLENQRCGKDEPVVLLLHLTCPRVQYTDRGKSAIVIGDLLGPEYGPQGDSRGQQRGEVA